jgi:4-hydroxy-3-methylbut-2-en-1-yl diphosphate reductase
MRILQAEHMGLCFGVRDAIQAARETEKPHEVTIFGELVHNPIVQSELRELGFDTVAEQTRDSSQLRDRVMITAHGISQKRLSELEASTKQLIDTTCPLVRRVHDAAMLMKRESRFVVVIGKPNHIEVQGITEDLVPDHWIVVENVTDVQTWNHHAIGVLCQSTTMPEVASACLEAITQLNPQADVRYVDTICRPTRQRQEALLALCKEAQLVIVVGGYSSNNTRQLAHRATQLGCIVHQVERSEEIESEWFDGINTVGVTAGTSTPDTTIQNVLDRLRAIAKSKQTFRATNLRPSPS